LEQSNMFLSFPTSMPLLQLLHVEICSDGLWHCQGSTLDIMCQSSPAVQTKPHPPQLFPSFLMSIHEPEHRSSLGGGHLHRPAEQIWPALRDKCRVSVLVVKYAHIWHCFQSTEHSRAEHFPTPARDMQAGSETDACCSSIEKGQLAVAYLNLECMVNHSCKEQGA
jgi:hypothetical protein